MKKFLISVLLVSSLASCSSLGKMAVGAVLDSGPSINANAQLGKENRQGFVLGTSEEVRGDKKVIEAGNVQRVEVTNTNFWMIVLLILGWVLPTPGQIAQTIRSWFSAKKFSKRV